MIVTNEFMAACCSRRIQPATMTTRNVHGWIGALIAAILASSSVAAYTPYFDGATES
jgi:hypothetical protein